ncbi:MAG: hypothetical protein M3068_11765 [Gemmatimonadota bacterium]|nr:hypothetical protein [Gemmatimonadota bacterium]
MMTTNTSPVYRPPTLAARCRVVLPDHRAAWLVIRYDDVVAALKGKRLVTDHRNALAPDGEVDRAIAGGETNGLVTLVTGGGGRILGGHVFGYGAGNLIAEVALAMKHGIKASALATMMPAYPTYPEAVREAAQDRLTSRLSGVATSIARWFATH